MGLPSATFWKMEDIEAGAGAGRSLAFNKQIRNQIDSCTTLIGICDESCASSHIEWGCPSEWQMGYVQNKMVLILDVDSAREKVCDMDQDQYKAASLVREVSKKIQFCAVPGGDDGASFKTLK